MIDLAYIGYFAAALLYAILSALLAVSWRGNRVGGLLLLACLVSIGWGIILGLPSSYGEFEVWILLGVEALRSGAFILFLSVLAGQLGVDRLFRAAANVAWVILALLGLVNYLGLIPPAVAPEFASALSVGGLCISLVGLLLIEQVYRNTRMASRWHIQPLVLGIGGLFAYDLFMYSQGVMFDAIDDVAWSARGAVNLLFVPLIAIAARRNARWDLDIFVSRHVVFYTSTLVAVGTYLLLMSAGGYLILLYGGSWGGTLRFVFLAGAILILMVLLFSATVRARFKVFLNKHFFRNKYDYREEWLRLITTLSHFSGGESRDVLIRALAQMVNSPGGVLWVIDEDETAFRSAASFEFHETVPDLEISSDLVRFIEKDFWLLDRDEYINDPEVYGHAEIGEWFVAQEKLWLIVPLVTGQQLMGLVGIARPPTRVTLNYEDRDLLKTAGQHIAAHLAQERSETQLTEARQFEAYNRLTAFLMHDLNNLIAQQSLIVKNAERHKNKPEFIEDAMTTIAYSVQRMKKIMATLKRGEGAAPERKSTRLKYLVSMAVDRTAGYQPVPTIDTTEADVSLEVDIERFVAVLTHLIRNAQDATPSDGEVIVSARQDAGDAEIVIRDTGEGMTREFQRDRLFRPFDSTKGSQGMGIGAYQAREFARSLGGDISVESAPGEGTTLTVRFPVTPPQTSSFGP